MSRARYHHWQLSLNLLIRLGIHLMYPASEDSLVTLTKQPQLLLQFANNHLLTVNWDLGPRQILHLALVSLTDTNELVDIAVALQCNLTSLLAIIPNNAIMLSSRNKITQQQYDITLQRSFLSLFNNIITIQCHDGLFFPDRAWSKQVICDLVNNSLTYSDWQGYQGTSLPLYSSCQSELLFFYSFKPLYRFYMQIRIHLHNPQIEPQTIFHDAKY